MAEPTTATPTITLEVFRYRPEESSERTYQKYAVPYREDWVVLDALNWIKDNVDGTLSYRWSCRMGVCGSCGMVVNEVPVLTCACFLRDYYPNPIRVEPLDHFPVERDLMIEMESFLERLKSVHPWIVRREGEEQSIDDGEYRQSPNQLAQFKQFSMCINCMLCYSACPVMALEPGFLGPAATALGMRYILDSRDQGKDERLDVIASHEGAWQCTFVGECSEVCPKDVDPAGALQQAKVLGTIEWYKSLLMPWAKRKKS